MESGMLAMILQEETSPPHSYKEYHEFLIARGCEENVEFLSDCILYQRLACQFFPDPIDIEKTVEILQNPNKIPFPKKPDSWVLQRYQDGLEMAKKQYTEICEKYILPGAPRQINIPNTTVKALQELMDMGYFHPDLLTESYFLIFEKLLAETLKPFLETQGEAVKTAIKDNLARSERDGYEIQSVQEELVDTVSIQNDDSFANTPNTSQLNIQINEAHSISPKTSGNASNAALVANSNRVVASQSSALKVTTGLTGSQASLNRDLSSDIVSAVEDITIDKVLANLTAPPFSRKHYREFLQITKSEENLDFLVEVMDYQKFATRFYAPTVLPSRTLDIFENCTQLSQFVRPPSLEDPSPQDETDTKNKIAAMVQDITNKYIKSGAEYEINLSSRIKKPLLMLIETGHYNPEIFTEAVTHIRDMLQQNGFDNFLKSADLSSPKSAEGGKANSTRGSVITVDTVKNTGFFKQKSEGSGSHTSSKRSIPSARFPIRTKRDESHTSLSSANRSSVSASNSPVSPRSINESIASKSTAKQDRKIMPSGRAAVRKSKPKKPSNLSQSNQSPRGSVTDEAPKDENSMQSYNSGGSHKSMSKAESTEDINRKSFTSAMEKVLSYESIRESIHEQAIPDIPMPVISIATDLTSNTSTAPTVVETTAQTDRENTAPTSIIDQNSISNTNSNSNPSPAPSTAPVVVKAPIMRSGRAAVQASGRAATPASARAAVPKQAVPTAALASADAAMLPSDASVKEKRGLFGFGKKK